jgi:CopG family nickel-responsive transcriptional regulator
MQRVTITLDEDLLAEIDRLSTARGDGNRSETIRDLVRSGLQQAGEERVDARECVGALVYVYDHTARELAGRLTRSFHDHHDLALATLHTHLDHDSCLEVAVLRGPATAMHAFAERVIAERGVTYGRLMAIPAHVETHKHAHGQAKSHAHMHLRVR